MRIQGAGTIREDQTSLDIHLELTNMNHTKPLALSVTTPATQASGKSTEHATGQTTAKNQQDIPFFGDETGKCIYITLWVA